MRVLKEWRRALYIFPVLAATYFLWSGHIVDVASARLRGEAIGCAPAIAGYTDLYWIRPMENDHSSDIYHLYLKEIDRSANNIAVANFNAKTPVAGTRFRLGSEIDQGISRTTLSERIHGIGSVQDGFVSRSKICRQAQDLYCAPNSLDSFNSTDTDGDRRLSGTLASSDGNYFEFDWGVVERSGGSVYFTHENLLSFLNHVPLYSCGWSFKALSHIAAFRIDFLDFGVRLPNPPVTRQVL